MDVTISRLVAKSAANECVASLREREGRQAFAQQIAQTEAAQATLAEIEAVVREIAKSEGSSDRARLRALSRLAKAVTTCAAEHSLAAMTKLSELRALDHIATFCQSGPWSEGVTDMHVLGSALAIFANVAFQGYHHLVVKAQVGPLLVRLLCPPTRSTDATIVSFAAATLNNLCSDAAAVAGAFSAPEVKQLHSAMKALLSDSQLAPAHVAAEEAAGRLRGMLGFNARQLEQLRKAASSRTRRGGDAALEESVRRLASEDVQRNDAAARMALKWRARLDAKKVARALDDRESMLSLVAQAAEAQQEDEAALARVRASEVVLERWHAEREQRLA